MADLSGAYAHCEAELRAERHDDWLAALFAPQHLRPRLHALGAMALELGRVRERVRQPAAGEIRLQWWREVVDGARDSEAAAHPVAAAALDVIRSAGLPALLIADLIDAHSLTLYDEPPADTAALERRLAALFGIPVCLSGLALGGRAETLTSASTDAGVALGIVALSRKVAAGRATDDLPADLAASGTVTAPAETIAALREVANARLAALRPRWAGLGPAAPAFLTTALVAPRLRHMRRAARAPGAETDIAAWRRQALLWLAARGWRGP